MFEKKIQEAHGPHHSHENQFSSKNTFEQSYDYIITLIKRGKAHCL